MLNKVKDDDANATTHQVREAAEVARRCIVLHAVIAAGHHESRPELVRWLRKEGLWEFVSLQEASFFEVESLTQQQYVNATWRAEALLPLLWALGRIEQMPPPVELCDAELLQDAMPPLFETVGEWLAFARLRDRDKIWAANEEIYQAHWKVRDAQLNHRSIPNGYSPEIVQERHHALNWLIGYMGQDWDEVTTDT